MPIQKPSFPTLTPTQLQEGFDKLKATVEQVRQQNGKLSVSKLTKEVKKANDPTMQAALDVFKDTFVEEKRVRVSSGGCGGSYTTTREVAKTKLESVEVKSVLSMLATAKRRAAKLDSNKDGTIDSAEALAASKMGGKSGELVRAALRKNIGAYVKELRDWTYALMTVHNNVSERQSVEKALKELASHHCKHKNGTKAITWSLRELATRGRFESWDVNAALNFADHGAADDNPLLAHVERTYGGRSDGRMPKGHLDNKEIRDLLNTDDLDGFVKTMRAKIDERLGISYLDYLKGTDLGGVDQLDDPDFQNKTAWELGRLARAKSSC